MADRSAVSLGKIGPEAFDRWIAPHLGASRGEVLVGPRAGYDGAIVRVGAGRVMAITTDPLSLVPALGPEDSARLACRLLASDAWASGIPPAFATCSFHFPPDLPDPTIGAYLEAMHAEWRRLEVAVVAGHTGRYEGCGLTIVGAGTLIGLGDEGRYLSPAFVQTGDRILVTKGCAIEATAIAARLFPERLAAVLDEAGLERARGLLEQVSVVEDCRALIHVGVRDRGVTCLHDATEGGVLGGLVELARASGNELRVEKSKIPLSQEARAACEVFGIDPYWTLSEGTLLATVRPAHVADALASLSEAGIVVADIGEVIGKGGKLWLTEFDGGVRPLSIPESDPYWAAYGRAVREGWK
ncbi:MAG TPA: AIR synthase family protein [Candidatus Eisenbacteria bacterium]|nr:AIR synthase family protein [Candidatus Eisenbacteria bacterium]